MKQPMNLKKRTVLQGAAVVLFVAAALFSALLTVLSLIPARTGLTVREKVTVASSLVSAEGETRQLSVRGRLRNTSDRAVTVEALEITLKGSPDTVLRLDEPFTVGPREDYDLMLSAVADHAADGTPELTATIDGVSVYLRNPADTPLIATVFPLAFAILFTILSVRAIRVLILLREERKMDCGGDGTR